MSKSRAKIYISLSHALYRNPSLNHFVLYIQNFIMFNTVLSSSGTSFNYFSWEKLPMLLEDRVWVLCCLSFAPFSEFNMVLSYKKHKKYIQNCPEWKDFNSRPYVILMFRIETKYAHAAIKSDILFIMNTFLKSFIYL